MDEIRKAKLDYFAEHPRCDCQIDADSPEDADFEGTLDKWCPEDAEFVVDHADYFPDVEHGFSSMCLAHWAADEFHHENDDPNAPILRDKWLADRVFGVLAPS